MPLAQVEDLTSHKQAAALVNLLVAFENLTELIFGVGRVNKSGLVNEAGLVFQDALQRAFHIGQPNAVCLSTIQMLDIEDSALFLTTICPQATDVNLRLGYGHKNTEFPAVTLYARWDKEALA